MNDLFANFFVFDSNFGLTDQSPGDIIYFLSKDDQLNFFFFFFFFFLSKMKSNFVPEKENDQFLF